MSEQEKLELPSAEREPEQIPLIDVGEWWENEWQGMPEFVAEDQTPHRTIYVHFQDRDAVREFSELVGQPITRETAWIWFPKVDRLNLRKQEYVRES